MAHMVPGPLASEARGKVGGVIFNRNRGGLYVKTFAGVTNPNTMMQVDRRTAMTNRSNAWKDLGATDKAAWIEYAAQTPLTNSLGQTYFMSGQQAYLRSALFADVVGIALAAAPGFGGEAQVPSLDGTSLQQTAPGLNLNDIPATWLGRDTAASARLAFGISPVISPGITYYKGPFRHLFTLAGNTAIVGGTVSLDTTTEYPTGGRVFLTIRQIDVEFRVSPLVTYGPFEIAAP